MKSKLKTILFGLALLMLTSSCEELIEVDRPRTRLITASVFDSEPTAIAAVLPLYPRMANGGATSVTYLTSLSADESMIAGNDQIKIQFYLNEIFSTNEFIRSLWKNHFESIRTANAVIEGLEKSDKLSLALRNQLMGEAKFFRAFSHFFLVNLFGEVPYITSTDYRINGLVSRISISQVYEKITTDLLEAKALLSEDYSYSQNERTRVNKWVASALLARVYLYTEDWIRAEEQATTVINKTSLYNLTDSLKDVFLKNSRETIWQVIPSNNQKYTDDGDLFNRPLYNPSTPALTEELYSAFETNDARRKVWVGVGINNNGPWYYPLKYKETSATGTGAEYYTIFRLAEQYLIRAESRARQNKLVGANSAESDLNIIRERAGLLPTLSVSQQELLSAIEQERRVELFQEWGHRWLDLKRTGRASAILSLVKPSWNDTDELYPVPFTELQLNPNMTQNPGY